MTKTFYEILNIDNTSTIRNIKLTCIRKISKMITKAKEDGDYTSLLTEVELLEKIYFTLNSEFAKQIYDEYIGISISTDMPKEDLSKYEAVSYFNSLGLEFYIYKATMVNKKMEIPEEAISRISNSIENIRNNMNNYYEINFSNILY